MLAILSPFTVYVKSAKNYLEQPMYHVDIQIIHFYKSSLNIIFATALRYTNISANTFLYNIMENKGVT